MRTAVRKLCGHELGGPSGVAPVHRQQIPADFPRNQGHAANIRAVNSGHRIADFVRTSHPAALRQSAEFSGKLAVGHELRRQGTAASLADGWLVDTAAMACPGLGQQRPDLRLDRRPGSDASPDQTTQPQIEDLRLGG
jgi:hypothetical protein